jgi:acyl-CoA synthetase (NDP forming)
MDAKTRFSAPDMSAAKVEALLNPRNIVILGATDKPGNWPQRVWRNLKRYGFSGPVYPLNPNRDQVWDTRCYKSFAELPEKPDHIIVLIPAALVPDALQQAAAAGARSATIMTSGFSEASDAASQKLAAKLARVIAETGLAVSGPNCLGNLNAGATLMTMPDDRPQVLAPGPVAIVGQSGGLAMAIKRTLEERGINSSAVVTSGNETGLTTADYIIYFARQPQTKVIVSYLESVKHPGAFLDACRTARAAGKPVVVVKLGASEDGRAAALAHTGALAGSMEAFDAVAGAAGAVRVRTLDDVVEAVEFFAHAPLPRGKGLGGITFSGGLRGLLLDAAAANGLRFVDLAPKTLQRLEKLLTVGTIIGNPLDSGFAALTSAEAYINCVEAIASDPGVDMLLLQEELPRGAGTERKEANLRAVNDLAARVGKPISFVTMISHGLTDYSRTLRADLPHVAFLQEVDKSLRAVRSVTDYAERARARPRKPARSVPASARTRLDALLTRRAAGPRTLSEVESKALLKAYGIACPKEGLATSAREAAEIATRIGFPVVAKAVSAALPHKSDAGGVLLGLQSAKAVRDAYTEITAKLGKRTALDGVLIAEMVSDGLELVLGVNRDPEVGPVILFGTGGVDLELTRDVALAPPPLDEAAAEALIARTRAGKLVAGYRGRPALDRKALVKALLGLSQLVMDAGERIDSIDINPFLLRRRGGVALDGLVVLGKAR